MRTAEDFKKCLQNAVFSEAPQGDRDAPRRELLASIRHANYRIGLQIVVFVN